jgi:hypothetical protein
MPVDPSTMRFLRPYTTQKTPVFHARRFGPLSSSLSELDLSVTAWNIRLQDPRCLHFGRHLPFPCQEGCVEFEGSPPAFRSLLFIWATSFSSPRMLGDGRGLLIQQGQGADDRRTREIAGAECRLRSLANEKAMFRQRVLCTVSSPQIRKGSFGSVLWARSRIFTFRPLFLTLCA